MSVVTGTNILVKYERRSVPLLDLLQMESLSVETKEKVWKQNYVSEKILNVAKSSTSDYHIKVLILLENCGVFGILKDNITCALMHIRNNGFVYASRQQVGAAGRKTNGIFYDVLMTLKLETLKVLFAGVDVTCCDPVQLSRALLEWIKQQNVAAVKWFEECFAASLCDIYFHGLVSDRVTKDYLDAVFDSDDDYLLATLMRYYEGARQPSCVMVIYHVNQNYHTSSKQWQRFFNYLISTDPDLTFLAAILSSGQLNYDATTELLRSCLTREVCEKMSEDKLNKTELLPLAVTLTSDVSAFAQLLKVFRSIIDPNRLAFATNMPAAL